jgi:tRNA nucleotidyltransferase (CCA-adding enzyme)
MNKSKMILFSLFKAAGNPFPALATHIKAAGGKVYFVGGSVRDFFLDQPIKDIDVEVFGITPPQLEEILSYYGKIDHIGKSFGVYKVKGLPLDITLPRTETKAGHDHKGFTVKVDPFLPLEEAAKRRDFTWNALYVEAVSGEIIDPFDGLKDLQSGIVRHIDADTFAEDPLRVLRAVQFAGRFGFTLHAGTKKLCRSLLQELPNLPKERIYEELNKLLLKAPKPSLGLRVAQETGVIDTLFPELNALIGCPQSAKYHPEGDVWEHTLLVVDAAAKVRDQAKNPLVLMYSALCHDMGKPATTKILPEGKIVSYGHERAGVGPARSFMQKLTGDKRLLQEITTLVKEHMNPYALYKVKASDAALMRLARRADVRELLLLAAADRQGRGDVSDNKNINNFTSWFENKITALSLDKKPEPLVHGQDLIEMGLKPGPLFGEYLRMAFEMQLEGKKRADILHEIRENIPLRLKQARD